NFIKVVQRLPVRIEPTNYNPEDNPLFIGLSVTPYVFIKEPATGPDAGKFLQPFIPLPTAPLDPNGNVKPIDVEANPSALKDVDSMGSKAVDSTSAKDTGSTDSKATDSAGSKNSSSTDSSSARPKSTEKGKSP